MEGPGGARCDLSGERAGLGEGRSYVAIITDRSTADSGAAGYSVAWQKGQLWGGTKVHVAYKQVAFDGESAALATAVDAAARWQTTQGEVSIFTDAQAVVRRCLGSAGPGQKFAIQAREWPIAALR